MATNQHFYSISFEELQHAMPYALKAVKREIKAKNHHEKMQKLSGVECWFSVSHWNTGKNSTTLKEVVYICNDCVYNVISANSRYVLESVDEISKYLVQMGSFWRALDTFMTNAQKTVQEIPNQDGGYEAPINQLINDLKGFSNVFVNYQAQKGTIGYFPMFHNNTVITP